MSLPSSVWASPFTGIGLVGAFALAALAGLPETTLALLLLVVTLTLTWRSPVNGIFFLALLTPFFLGESGWPWYGLPESLIGIVVVVAAIRLRRAGQSIAPPLAPLVALFLLAAAASLPIDGREFYAEFWVGGVRGLFDTWLSGHPDPKTTWLRGFTNLLSAVILFGLTYRATLNKHERIVSYLGAATLMAGALSLVGITMRYGGFTAEGSYLTLSLVGSYAGGITTFSYALHFFNQYLLLILPLALGAIVLATKPSATFFYALLLLMLVFVLLQGGLRTSALTVFLTFLVMGGFGAFSFARGRKMGAVALVLIGVAIVAAFLLTKGLAFERFSSEIGEKFDADVVEHIGEYIDNPLYFMKHGILEPRFFLWHTAVRMVGDSPLLGVGLGRYTGLFYDYFASDWRNWYDIGFASGATAHSLYFEVLANQGFIGLTVWSLLIGAVLLAAFRHWRSESDRRHRWMVATLGGSSLIWLVIGVAHYPPLCRAIEILFWIHLGLLAALCRNRIESLTLPKNVFPAFVALIFVSFLWQLHQVAERPLDPGFSVGFSHWEERPDGSLKRWMGKRGVTVARTQNGVLALSLACPLPHLGEKPQKVTLMAGGEKRALIFSAGGERTARFSLPEGDYLVHIETAYTYNPKRAGGSGDNRNLGVMVGGVKPQGE